MSSPDSPMTTTDPAVRFTPRELEVIELLCADMSRKEIAKGMRRR